MVQIKIKCRGKSIGINVKKVNPLSRISGLMFRSKETGNLLFEFNHPVNLSIHSVFVFFPFLAVWLNKKNKVVQAKIVKPFNLSAKPKKPFSRLVEIPLNNRNRQLIRNIVGKETFK